MIKEKFIKFYINVADQVAQLSSAERLKVGAIAVKDNNIISFGYNGMPSGWDNKCETWQDDIHNQEYMVTNPEVLHAETNLIAKIAKSNNTSDGAILFLTHAPCLNCAKQIYQAGFKAVFYKTAYRMTDGLEFLTKCNILVRRVE
jgi:dCMP deaminase